MIDAVLNFVFMAHLVDIGGPVWGVETLTRFFEMILVCFFSQAIIYVGSTLSIVEHVHFFNLVLMASKMNKQVNTYT